MAVSGHACDGMMPRDEVLCPYRPIVPPATGAPPTAARLKATAGAAASIFDALVTVVHDPSLGQVTRALHEVGGQYRRSM